MLPISTGNTTWNDMADADRTYRKFDLKRTDKLLYGRTKNNLRLRTRKIVRTDLQNDYIWSKAPNHVEVIVTKISHGSTANTEQMHRSSAVKVKIAICLSVKSSLQVRLQSFYKCMTQNKYVRHGAGHGNKVKLN